jgi:hypothetical protein
MIAHSFFDTTSSVIVSRHNTSMQHMMHSLSPYALATYARVAAHSIHVYLLLLSAAVVIPGRWCADG